MKLKIILAIALLVGIKNVFATDTVTTNQYEWDAGHNTSIAIPSSISKNFCITFDANPKNDFHIGLYSSSYTRILDASGSYIQSKEATPLQTGSRNTLSAIVEFCYGGWGNIQSAIRVDFMNTRSARSKETILPGLTIPEANKGVFRTYTVTVNVNQDSFNLILAYQDPTTNTPIIIQKITQDDLSFAVGSAPAESTFDALRKPSFEGFTKLGFLVYDTTYSVKNVTVTQSIDAAAIQAAQDKIAADAKAEADRLAADKAAADAKIKADADAAAAKAAADTASALAQSTQPNVTSCCYQWEDGKNISIPVPTEYKTNFCLTFQANPEQDLDIGLYSNTYKRIINDKGVIQAQGVPADQTRRSFPLSAIVELAYGGWTNSQSAVSIECHSTRIANAKQIIVRPNVAIPSQDVGVFRTYQVTTSLTTSTFSFALAVQDPQTYEFRNLISVTQDELPPATVETGGESIFDALKKLLSTGFTHVGFVGYGKGYEVKNWKFSPFIDTAAVKAAEKQAQELAAKEADRLAAEKQAQDLAAQTKRDAEAAAVKAAADKAAADAKIKAETEAAAKAAADKAASDAKIKADTEAAADKIAASATTEGAGIKLSAADIKKQATATKQYEATKTKLQTTLNKAIEGQSAAAQTVASTEKITNTTTKKQFTKEATQLKATLDDYVIKLSKSQKTLALTPPPFTTPALIAQGQRNADNILSYTNTALGLVNQRIKTIETLQKKINKATGS